MFIKMELEFMFTYTNFVFFLLPIFIIVAFLRKLFRFESFRYGKLPWLAKLRKFSLKVSAI